ncbi:MAG: hypothetical protein OEU68_16045, partial [Nitrospira sp.]|nr:hypothetical protein [Nitrospira sp.]
APAATGWLGQLISSHFSIQLQAPSPKTTLVVISATPVVDFCHSASDPRACPFRVHFSAIDMTSKVWVPARIRLSTTI